MGFPESYPVPQAGRPTVVRGFGNAVSPPVAREVFSQIARAA